MNICFFTEETALLTRAKVNYFLSSTDVKLFVVVVVFCCFFFFSKTCKSNYLFQNFGFIFLLKLRRRKFSAPGSEQNPFLAL